MAAVACFLPGRAKDLSAPRYRGQERCIRGFWWGDPRERDHSKDLDVDGRIMLKWLLKKWDEESWTGLFWFMIVTYGGLL